MPIAAKQIPVLRVSGFKADGALIALSGLQADVMSGIRISNAEVREEYCDRDRGSDECPALRVAGKT